MTRIPQAFIILLAVCSTQMAASARPTRAHKCATDGDCAGTSCCNLAVLKCTYNTDLCDIPPSSATTAKTTSTHTTTSKTSVPDVGSADWSFPNWNGQENSWKSAWGVNLDSYGSENRAFVPDPAGSGVQVLELTYPAGSYIPSQSPVGGTGFYAQPISIPNGSTVIFEYQVYFPDGFDFVKGGKLPGLIAGHDDCSGGNPATDCFSTRFMWRANGAGEVYAYIPKSPQAPSICNSPDVCNVDYGFSLGRGDFSFLTGQWTTLRQTVTPNSQGSALTGILIVEVNGKKVMSFNNLDYRLSSKIPIIGIDFESFFGGHDNSYATPSKQVTYFKGFSITLQ